jgi:hypothetical protein
MRLKLHLPRLPRLDRVVIIPCLVLEIYKAAWARRGFLVPRSSRSEDSNHPESFSSHSHLKYINLIKPVKFRYLKDASV